MSLHLNHQPPAEKSVAASPADTLFGSLYILATNSKVARWIDGVELAFAGK